MINFVDDFSKARKLHPLTIVFFGLRSSIGFILPAYFAVSHGDRSALLNLGISIVFSLIFSFPLAYLRYINFRFWITPKEIVLKSGIIARKQRLIPINKVQNIDITQSFLQRLLGLSRVSIETAGELKAEGVLEFVSLENANDIRNVIQTYQLYNENQTNNASLNTNFNNDYQNITNKTEKVEPQEKILLNMSAKQIWIYSILNISIVKLIILPLALPFVLYANYIQFSDGDSSRLISGDFYVNILHFLSNNGIVLGILLYFISMIAVWLIISLFTFNNFYNFKLSFINNKLNISRGLLNKVHGTIPLKKLQSLQLVTNIFTRQLNYWGLNLKTAGTTRTGMQQQLIPDTVVPLDTYENVLELAKGITNFKLPEYFHPISKKNIQKAFLRLIIFLAFFITIAYFFLPIMLYLLVLLPLLIFSFYLLYQSRGWFVDNECIIIKQGWFNQKISIIPISKIQTLNVHETIFQRMLGLATLCIDTAASPTISDALIIDIDKHEAVQIMNIINDSFKNLK